MEEERAHTMDATMADGPEAGRQGEAGRSFCRGRRRRRRRRRRQTGKEGRKEGAANANYGD